MMQDELTLEKQRLLAIAELAVLDTSAEAGYDDIVKVAASICSTPISLITLIDSHRQWFKANIGLEGVTETPRADAFCAHAVQYDGIFEIQDAQADKRFSDNPLVTGHPNIRFYAGAPLQLSNGIKVGTLCVIDKKPGKLNKEQRKNLTHLSSTVVRLLETRRFAADQAESEARFRALSASAPLGVFSTTPDGECTYTNKRWQDIFGMSGADAMGFGWSQTLHTEDKAAVFSKWQHSASIGANFDMKFRIRHSNGRLVFVRAISRPVLNAAGEISSHIGSVEDITEQLLLDRKLLDERRRLAAIIDGTNAGTWEWNIQSGEMRCNEYWAQMLGRTLEELSPLSTAKWKALIHPDDHPEFDRALEKHLVQNNEMHDCEVRMQHATGDWVWMQVRGRFLGCSTSDLDQWMYGTVVDISKRKAQEKALRESKFLLAETGAMANVGGWSLDIATMSLSWTDQTFHIHGLVPGAQPTLEEAISYYTDDAVPVITDAVSRAISDGRSWDLELPMVNSNGDCIWVHSIGRIESNNGKAVRVLGACQDITQRVVQRHALENAHERMTIATESGDIGIWELTLATNELSWTTQMYALYGFAENTNSISFLQWEERLHPDDRPVVLEYLHAAVAGSASTLDTEFRVLWPDNSVHHIRCAAKISRQHDGQATHVLGVNWDVSPLRKMSNELAQQHELLQVTMQSIGDAVITCDTQQRITWLNPVAEHLTGWTLDEAANKPIKDVFKIVNEESRKPAINPISECIQLNRIVSLQPKTVLISRSGIEFGIEDSAAPIRSKTGELLGVVLVFHDVSEQRQLANEMYYRATHDKLTGLVNRSEFEHRLQNALVMATQQAVEHALMYVDLDQFKLVNDSCGHYQGDQLLVKISRLITEIVRREDTVARIGGDEFALLLMDCGSEQAKQIAQQICDSMDDFRFVHQDRRFRIGASIGLVPIDKRWKTIGAAMQAADVSCYAAKDAGRNRVHVWYETDTALLDRKNETKWATRLEEALDEHNFELSGQIIHPISSVSEGMCVEVLIRMRGKQGDIVYPNLFIPAAERFRLASRIDRWVLRKTIGLFANLDNISDLNTLFVNLSGQSVGDPVFQADAIRMLEIAGSAVCEKLCLEITETAAVTNISEASNFVNEVRKLGVRVALDDFGAGASAFGYLKTLKVDVLKIDGQFIEGIIDDPLNGAAVRSFVDVARVMGIETIAEYVADEQVYERIREMGIDYAQGFYLHRPEPIERLLQKPAFVENQLAEIL